MKAKLSTPFLPFYAAHTGFHPVTNGLISDATQHCGRVQRTLVSRLLADDPTFRGGLRPTNSTRLLNLSRNAFRSTMANISIGNI